MFQTNHLIRNEVLPELYQWMTCPFGPVSDQKKNNGRNDSVALGTMTSGDAIACGVTGRIPGFALGMVTTNSGARLIHLDPLQPVKGPQLFYLVFSAPAWLSQTSVTRAGQTGSPGQCSSFRAWACAWLLGCGPNRSYRDNLASRSAWSRAWLDRAA